MKTSEQSVLDFLIAEAAELVIGGMDADAAFLAACKNHENMLMAAQGYNMGAEAERMNKLIEVAGKVTYEKLSA